MIEIQKWMVWNNSVIPLLQKLMIYNANRDGTTFNTHHLSRKGDPFARQVSHQQANEPKTPKSNNSFVGSKPSLKLSFVSNTQNTNATNKTLDNIRNSCFVGNIVPQRDQQNKPFSNLNNSFRFSECIPSSPHEEARRKSQSIHSKNFGIELRSAVSKQVQITRNTDGVLNLIEELQRRVLKNTQDISKLQERNEQNKRLSNLQLEVVDLKTKLVELAKLNNKTNNQNDCKLLEHSLKLNEFKQRIAGFNPTQHTKKYGILEAKLNQLYEGFRIREEHNERELINSITNLDLKAKEYVNVETFKLNETLNQSLQAFKGEFKQLQTTISKIEEQLSSKMTLLAYDTKRSNKKSDTFIVVQNAQTIAIKDDSTQPNQSPLFSTPKKIHIDTPRQAMTKPINSFTVKQIKYYIDSEGYLLDEDHFYLLDSKDQQILLSSELINCLRQNGILREPSLDQTKP